MASLPVRRPGLLGRLLASEGSRAVAELFTLPTPRAVRYAAYAAACLLLVQSLAITALLVERNGGGYQTAAGKDGGRVYPSSLLSPTRLRPLTSPGCYRTSMPASSMDRSRVASIGSRYASATARRWRQMPCSANSLSGAMSCALCYRPRSNWSCLAFCTPGPQAASYLRSRCVRSVSSRSSSPPPHRRALAKRSVVASFPRSRLARRFSPASVASTARRAQQGSRTAIVAGRTSAGARRAGRTCRRSSPSPLNLLLAAMMSAMCRIARSTRQPPWPERNRFRARF